MRLDRLRSEDVGLATFSLAGGVTPANDRAQLAANRHELIRGDARHESELEFLTQSTYPLEDLRLTLLAIIGIMKEYRVTSVRRIQA